MSFQMYLNQVLENFNSISLFDMGLVLLLSFALVYLYFMYIKEPIRSYVFIKLGVTLIALSMIAVLILAVTSNVVLSLGMVGLYLL